MGQGIRILLVDDHGLFRESLSRLLQAESDLQIAGSCSTIPEALDILAREPVDVVLLDYDLGDEHGLFFLDSCRSEGYECKVLMVTAGMSDADSLRALERGASGIFLKHSPPDQLVEAIAKVMAGEMWLDSRAVRSVVAGASGKTEEQRGSQWLNRRERAVLKSVLEGLSNKEIATQLEISETTVKWVMQQLFDKTGVRTRSQLVRIALEKHYQDWLLPGETA